MSNWDDFKNWWDEVDFNPFNSDFKADPAVNNFRATPNAQYDFGAALMEAQRAQSAARAQQADLIAGLTAQANGTGVPSLAEMQLRAATDSNIARGAGMIGSAQGANPALAGRQIAQQTAQANQALAGQAAQLRAQEQLAAQGLLGQTLGQARGQDQQMFGAGAQGFGAQNANATDVDQINATVTRGNQIADLEAQRLDQLTQSQSAESNNRLGTDLLRSAADALVPKPAAHGALVPGRANVPGDSLANDTVLIAASPGEAVIPRSVMQSEDPAARAADFVEALMREQAMRPRGGR